MLRVGVHVTVEIVGGNPVAESAVTQTVLSPEIKNPMAEVEAGVEMIEKLIERALEETKAQMMDFAKVVSS